MKNTVFIDEYAFLSSNEYTIVMRADPHERTFELVYTGS